jgi:hypothetical protein
MSDLPQEAERLLATAPDEFVAERGRVARELRDAGRRQEAAAVAEMRKPPAVVLAVNRAARDRPQVARDAVAAAARVLETQFSGDPQSYREATKELDRALEMLADVAVVHVSRGKAASDPMARRVRDLLRAAIADDEGRDALVRGVLAEERETAGFASLAGAVPARPSRRPTRGKEGTATTAKRERDAKRERVKRLRAELANAESALQEAERELRRVAGERDRADEKVAALREKLDAL